MKNKSYTLHQRPPSRSGFTLIELLVVIAIIAILASMLLPALAKAKQRAMTAGCQNAMKQAALGYGMYGADNHQKIPITRLHRTAPLPSGVSEGDNWSWDDYVMSYLGSPFGITTGKSTWIIDWNPTRTGSDATPQTHKWAICPADKVQAWNQVTNPSLTTDVWRAVRRSYSMPQHNGGKPDANFNWDISGNTIPTDNTWPPNPGMKTAMGLVLRQAQPGLGSATPPNDGWWGWRTDPFDDVAGRLSLIRRQPAVTDTMVMDPSGTIMLTERISAYNYLGNAGWAEVEDSDNQFHTGSETTSQMVDTRSLHGLDTYDYTFADGHVETLSKRATLGNVNTTTSRQSGMWTVNPKH